MRVAYKNPKIKFYIGDVRDHQSILEASKNVDYIFHSAALKQVPACEFFPIEATKTNVLGTSNVLTSAIKHGVKKVICLSTDKAVYPINAMGISKAMMEKVAIAESRNLKDTVVCLTRYGNVMFSRGSLIPFLIKKIHMNEELTLTDPSMTRFMMSLEDSVNLVKEAFKYGKNGDIYVQKSPAASIKNISLALLKLFKKKNKIKIYSTTLQNSNEYHREVYKDATAIVVGAEATGLTEIWRENSTRNINIPMLGQIDSMNVSVAAAIVIFEVKRQQKFI